MSNLVDHARRELAIIGEEPETIDGYAGGETNLPKDDPDITAGYPLWVDGKAVNGQEAGA